MRPKIINIVIFLTSISLAILLSNFAAHLWVQSKIETENDFALKLDLWQKQKPLLEKFDADLHHIRGTHFLREGMKATDLLFTTFSEYESKDQKVLIQGDSWAEAGDTKASTALRHFADQRNVGLVTAGTSSYAPIVMSRQIIFLRKQFDIRPNIVVAIIDQTDIGDTICRYKELLNLDVSSKYHKNRWGPPIKSVKKNENLLSDDFAAIKLLKHIWLQAQDRVQRLGAPNRSWSCIVDPLQNGVSSEVEKIFVNTLNQYVDVVFADDAVKKLYFVTHPHLKNLSGEYKGDVAQIVDRFLKNGQTTRKICHISFSKEASDLYGVSNYERIFREADKASHLKDEIYAEIYYPRILRALQLGECSN